jgi:hypothetical protein
MDVRELRVAKRNVLVFGDKGRKDVAERGQGLVDELRLFQPLPRGFRLGNPLRPSQVHEHQLSVGLGSARNNQYSKNEFGTTYQYSKNDFGMQCQYSKNDFGMHYQYSKNRCS